MSNTTDDDREAARLRVHNEVWHTPPQQINGGMILRAMLQIHALLTALPMSEGHNRDGLRTVPAVVWPLRYHALDGRVNDDVEPIDRTYARARLSALTEELDARLPAREE